MPVYNGDRYLGQAIESVLAQTIADFELLIWDDGSEDCSREVALSYAQRDSRVQVFSAEHRGIAASFNAAVARATGQYIGGVDSDDVLAPTALQETKQVLDSQPEVGFVYTDYIVIDEQDRKRRYGGRCATPYSKEKLLEWLMTFHFRLFHKALFEQVGRIDETLEYAVDYDLCLKLSEVTEFVHLRKPLYYYRSHANNVSHQKRQQQEICAAQAISNAKKRRGIFNDYSSTSQSKPMTSSASKKLSFHWSSTAQVFACDAVSFSNSGMPTTEPSHDIVHLIVAANGGLPWLPERQRNLACLSEYNTVLLENLFDRICNLVIFKTSTSVQILAETLEHMRWFVEKHFAPFPVSSAEAYQRFCQNIDPFVVSRLFPYYLVLKKYEKNSPNYRQAEFKLTFTSADQPTTDEESWQAQWLVYQQLKIAKSSKMGNDGTSDWLETALPAGLIHPSECTSTASRVEGATSSTLHATTELNQAQSSHASSPKVDLFNVVLVETHNRCSRQCWFCKFGQERQDQFEQSMSDEVLLKVANNLQNLDYSGRISPFGINEPLLDSRIINIIQLFRSTCPKAFISINTNGDRLTDNLLQDLMDAGLDALGISIYDNPGFKKLARFGQSGRVTLLDMRQPEQTIENRGGQVKINAARFCPEQFVTSSCQRPFNMLVIRATGLVALCCADMYSDVVMGDVSHTRLEDIWHSEAFNTYRSKLMTEGRTNLQLCQNCSHSGITSSVYYPSQLSTVQLPSHPNAAGATLSSR